MAIKFCECFSLMLANLPEQIIPRHMYIGNLTKARIKTDISTFNITQILLNTWLDLPFTYLQNTWIPHIAMVTPMLTWEHSSLSLDEVPWSSWHTGIHQSGCWSSPLSSTVTGLHPTDTWKLSSQLLYLSTEVSLQVLTKSYKKNLNLITLFCLFHKCQSLTKPLSAYSSFIF